MFNIKLPLLVTVAISIIAFSIGGYYVASNPGDNFLASSRRALSAIKYYFYPNNEYLQSLPSVKKAGVTRNTKSVNDKSYTLYSSMSQPKAYLMDGDGTIVHEWDLNFVKNIWIPSLFEKKHAVINEAELFPNGDLLTVIINEGSTPWGGGIVKVDKNSKPLWVYKDKLAHHDLSLDPKGNIYTLTHELITSSDKNTPSKNYIDDKITLLDSNGKEIKSLPIQKMIEKSPVFNKLVPVRFKEIYENATQKRSTKFDPLHSNTIHYIDEQMAKDSGFLHEGNVLVLLRNLDLIIEVNIESEEIVNVLGGPWKHPHHPLILPNGNILIFDNRGEWPKSRIIEYDPAIKKIVWSYDGTDDVPFQSIIWGKIQNLDNGNILVTQPIGGRIFELNKDKEIVWEYSNPDKVERSEMVWNISYAYRYAPEYVRFLHSDDSDKD